MTIRRNNLDNDTLDFHYIKSRFFRVLHTDGTIGNITPKGDIFIGFYNERPSLPDKMTYRIEGSKLGQPINVETEHEGIMRELDAAIVMDYDVAKTFLVWLSGQVSQLEKLMEQSEQAEQLKSEENSK